MRVDRERASVEAFYVLLGLSLVATVVTEISSDVWGVHEGRLFPFRHVWPLPLLGVHALAALWGVLGATGVAIGVGIRRAWALRVALVAAFVDLTQSFSNARSLAVIVLFFVALSPPEPRAASFALREHPNMGLVRAQLVIVYLFSALNKIAHGFVSGVSLHNLFGWSLATSRALSIVTVLGEIALPMLLVRAPVVGLVGVVVMHAAFAWALPGLWPFTFLMVGMGALFAARRSPT
jgi:hypothetical protein